MWSRRSVLMSGAALLGLPARAALSSNTKLVMVVASGGWDVTFGLDPKLSSDKVEGPEVYMDPAHPNDVESVQTYAGLPIAYNPGKRPAVTAFFEAYAERVAVINGIWMGVLSHEGALMRALTGSRDRERGDLCAIVGNSVPSGLGYVDLGGLGLFGAYSQTSGRAGRRRQIKALLDPQTHFKAPEDAGYRYPLYRPKAQHGEALREWANARAERFRDDRGALLGTDRAVDDYLVSMDAAATLRTLGSDLMTDVPWGGDVSFAGDVRFAVELLANDACRSVLLTTRQQWDTHADNRSQHNSWNVTFAGLSTLMAQLDASGLYDDTLVVVISEMTRTPLMNRHGGKDHWPHTSALLFGGPVQGGRVLGGTDDLLLSRPVDLATGELDDAGQLLRYDNLAAGILELVDVDPSLWFPGVTPLRGLGG